MTAFKAALALGLAISPLAIAQVKGPQPAKPAKPEPAKEIDLSNVDPDPKSLIVDESTLAIARSHLDRLDEPSYEERAAAVRELRLMGRTALPVLREGIEKSDSPEVVLWCEALLDHAIVADVKARLDCFLADKDGKFQHDLPGAKAFFQIAGATDQARSLFREMMLSPNRNLLVALAGKSEEIGKAASAKRAELNPRTFVVGNAVEVKKASSLDVIALLFVESQISEKFVAPAPAVGMNANPTYVMTQSNLRTDLETDPKKDAYRAIVQKWFDSREEGRTLYYCLTAANQLKIPITPTMAKKAIEAKGITPSQRGMAVCTLARIGSAKDCELLETMLTDETVVYPGAVGGFGGGGAPIRRSPIQLRDTALAMLLIAYKQDPIDYGFTSRYKGTTLLETQKFNYINFHFDDSAEKADESRKAALKKWDETKKELKEAAAKKDPKKDK